jgi:integrase/recombinase XerD
MVTYKVLLDERRIKSDGTYPIIIRITCNRQVCTINSGANIQKEYWDIKGANVKSSYANAQLINRKVTEFYLKVQKVVLELEGEGLFDFDFLKERLNSNYKPTKAARTITFKDYAQRLIDSMLNINKAGNAIIYQTATNRLLAYANNPNIKFTEITFTFLDGFKNNLIKSGLKANSISNYFRTLRAIYNKAIKEKLIDRSYYPFLDITVKTERTAKRAITLDELISIIKLDLKVNSQEWKARSYFLLSFALRGASFTDLAYLKPENIRKGYLTYKRRKTGKELKIKLLSFTNDIINDYHGSNSKYLLPILPPTIVEDSLAAKKVILQWIKTSNKYLNRLGEICEIEDEITSYVTRHTFATLAKKKLGYSNEVIAECLGHEYGNKITNTYLDNYDQSLIDEVNERMIKLIE